MAVAQQLKKWLADPVDHVALQVPRALALSVVCTLLDCAILVVLVEQAGWHAAPAAVVGYLAGTLLNYLLCSAWVFSTEQPSGLSGYLTFTVLSLVGLAITVATIEALALVHVHAYFGKLVALGFSFTWNFLSRKWLLFRSRNPLTPNPSAPIRAGEGSVCV